MKKITTNNNIINQIKNNNGRLSQIDSMQAYINQIDDICNIYSYNTKIAEYNTKTNILKLTTKKYSRTTTKQQNKIKANIIKYTNCKVEAL